MKRLIVFFMTVFILVSLPNETYADTLQIPARPTVDTSYYEYYAIFYNKYKNAYILVYSTEPFEISGSYERGNIEKKGSYVTFVWLPNESETWENIGSWNTYYSAYNYSGLYSLYLSGNYDLKLTDGTVISEQASDTTFTEHAKATYNAYADYWTESESDGGIDISGILSGITSVINAITSLPSKIADKLLDVLKSLFLPSDGYIEEKIEYLKERFNTAFGIEAYDISSIFSSETALDDLTVTLYGSTVTIVKMDYVKTAIATFRTIIRGFICLLLAFYNINQFLVFIKQSPITMGIIVKTNKANEEKSD